jgi:hypothetical protein
MPEGFLKIKRQLRKTHPTWSKQKIEQVAAKIWNKDRAGGQTVGRGRK